MGFTPPVFDAILPWLTVGREVRRETPDLLRFYAKKPSRKCCADPRMEVFFFRRSTEAAKCQIADFEHLPADRIELKRPRAEVTINNPPYLRWAHQLKFDSYLVCVTSPFEKISETKTREGKPVKNRTKNRHSSVAKEVNECEKWI